MLSRAIARAGFVSTTMWMGACASNPPPTPAEPKPEVASESAAGGRMSATNPDSEAASDQGHAGGGGSRGPASVETTPSDAMSNDAAAGDKPPETRTMSVIRRIVMDNRKPARKCYEDARKDLKDLQGDVVIHFVLGPDGKVRSAELNQERSTLKSPAVVDCVVAVIKSIDFPKSSRGMETSANYPFNFTP